MGLLTEFRTAADCLSRLLPSLDAGGVHAIQGAEGEVRIWVRDLRYSRKDYSRNQVPFLLNSVRDLFNARVEFGLIESRARMIPKFGPRRESIMRALGWS